MRQSALPIVALLAILPAGAKTLTYVEVLDQLTDLDRLTHLQTGIRAGQFSSHSPDDRVWGTNGDAGNYLRVEENGEAVMMEVDGPGCIYRLWSANPMGELRFYLDGATEPTYTFDFDGLFSGQHPPFVKPLVYKRGAQMSASDCYLPIPFAKSIKVCADQKHGQFYILNYLRFPADWEVQSFHLPLSVPENEALERAVEAWSHPGRDPKPRRPGQTTLQRRLSILPGQTVALADLAGPGEVRGLRCRVDSSERFFWRKLVLRGVWDGADWPQILAPLGPFFGFDWQTPEYGSLIAGCLGGRCYFYYPMPFAASGRLELTSYLATPASLEAEIDWAPLPKLPDDSLYFYARWRHEPDCPTFDYPFIETAGRGHLVGVTLQIDHPVPGWWGEGDEKVWVDDDQFPPWIGTGSEDYFGDAWGIQFLPNPSHGCSLRAGHYTCPYRWHFLDFIPFTKRLRMTIENYGSWGNFDHEHEYNSVAYWYQRERVPPFGNLSAATYIGGAAPGQKPAVYRYRPDRFRDITAADVLTGGLSVPYCEEAEALFGSTVGEGKATLISDLGRPQPFNQERALDFGRVEPGASLANAPLYARQQAVYYPKLYTSPEPDTAELLLKVDGEPLEITGRPQPGVLELKGVLLTVGAHPVELVAVSAGHAVLDAIQLERATRVEGSIEAEDLETVRHDGGEAPHRAMPLRAISGGMVLGWHAEADGQGFVLRLPAPPRNPYLLGVRPMFGPQCGVIQAHVDGRPIGPKFDLYADQLRPSPIVLPLGVLPQGAQEIEIRVVAQNPKATDRHVGLDFFRWEPLILHYGESAPGVWALVERTERCAYRIQDLGNRWLGNHHLWIQPSQQGATVDIGLQVPEAGRYVILVRYTTSWDYAIVRASLNGQPLGEPVDLYTKTVELTEPLTLGAVDLPAGHHTLRFEAIDKNPESKGYLMGIDYIVVKRAP